ncbi:hypothetical protein EV702DRAFT_1043777 [Suillus placidus]|uniref:Uncharacterized protein n=1 Tax=Suillus placidus TaxID=48579 RepID=A0A9P6ZZM4_9AGAM|nr:hypothetical protein EV702DRAFT_1043777 [Suillus placidus]
MAKTQATSAPQTTHHMNTDSRENKRTRSASPSPDPSESEDGQNSNKRLTVEKSVLAQPIIQTPPPVNQWHYLQMGEANNNIDHRPPTGGFPTPQLGQSVWRNVAPTLRERRPQKESPKAWACTFCTKYEENAQMTTIKMCNVIALIIGETVATSLLISTPSAEGELYERLPPPYHFLISGIPQNTISRLTGLGVCSTPEITCFFIPFAQLLPNYICTLEHFTFPDCKESNTAIVDLVKHTIRIHPNTLQFIHRNIPSPDAKAAIRTINSICVTSLNIAVARSITHTMWNVQVDSPPNLSLKEYFEWTNLICDLQFASEDYGTGLVHSEDRQFLCTGCKSYDHPSGLCPYPKLLGWFGPTASTNKDMSNVSLDNRINTTRGGTPQHGGRGYTGRGRGRSRCSRGQY